MGVHVVHALGRVLSLTFLNISSLTTMVADTHSQRASNLGPARWTSLIGKPVETPHYRGAPGILR